MHLVRRPQTVGEQLDPCSAKLLLCPLQDTKLGYPMWGSGCDHKINGFSHQVLILLPQVCQPLYFAFLGGRPVVNLALFNLAGLRLQHGHN